MNPNESKNPQRAVGLGVGSIALFVLAFCGGAICVVRWSARPARLDDALLTLILAVASTLFGLAGAVLGLLGWRRTKQQRSAVCTGGVILNVLVIAALWLWVAFLPY